MNLTKNDTPRASAHKLLIWVNSVLIGAFALTIVVVGFVIADATIDPSHYVITGTAGDATLKQDRITVTGPLPDAVDITSISATMHVSAGFTGHLLVALSVLPGAAVVIFILLMMRRIVISTLAGSPFSNANASRLRLIGLALTILWPIATIINDFVTYQRLRAAGLSDLIESFTIDISASLLPFLMGAMFLVAGVVFRQGVTMRKEVEGLV